MPCNNCEELSMQLEAANAKVNRVTCADGSSFDAGTVDEIRRLLRIEKQHTELQKRSIADLTRERDELKATNEGFLEIISKEAITYRKQLATRDELIDRAIELMQPEPFRRYSDWHERTEQWLADAKKR